MNLIILNLYNNLVPSILHADWEPNEIVIGSNPTTYGNYLPGDSFKKIRLLPDLPHTASPAVTCLVTIPHKVLMSHKGNEFFKVLTARCPLSTLGIFGYSEIFLTLS